MTVEDEIESIVDGGFKCPVCGCTDLSMDATIDVAFQLVGGWCEYSITVRNPCELDAPPHEFRIQVTE